MLHRKKYVFLLSHNSLAIASHLVLGPVILVQLNHKVPRKCSLTMSPDKGRHRNILCTYLTITMSDLDIEDVMTGRTDMLSEKVISEMKPK